MIDLGGGPIMKARPSEEGLRATAGVRGAVRLSSWRGRSGRRYVVGIHPLTEKEVLDIADAVLIAVLRGPDGAARIVDTLAAGPKSRGRGRPDWLARMRDLGATELHVHRLADGDGGRRAAAEDLRDERAPE
jgi:hypothetical protein